MPSSKRTNGHRPTGLLHLLDPSLKLAPHPKQEDLNFNLYDTLDAVVQLTAIISEDAFSAQTLGQNREGNAILISSDGLLVTIGYLVVDAYSISIRTHGGKPVPAELVGYSHETGIAIIHALEKLPVKPIKLGKTDNLKENSPVIIAPYGGENHSISAKVASRREFAGSWEYMIENAIFTTPIHPNWSGAALISDEGKLCGIGSLWVNDAKKYEKKRQRDSADESLKDDPNNSPGNMFVPIDLLEPIYDDLISFGVASGQQRPWLGMYTSEEMNQLFVSGIIPDAPADLAEIEPGDIIVALNGQSVKTLSHMYKVLWSLGAAGIEIVIKLCRDGTDIDVTVKTDSRYSFMEKRKKH